MTDTPARTPEVRGALIVALYGAGWFAALMAINLVAVLALLGPALRHGFDPDALRALVEELGRTTRSGGLPPWLLAGTLAIQMPTMLGLAEGIRLLAQSQIWRDAIPETRREVFGWRRASLRGWLTAALLGFTTGWLPGWVAAQLQEALPWLSFGSMELINKALTEGPLLARGIVLTGIVLGAPLVEELVFRGFMWRAMERSYGPTVAWISTSLMFAAYHMDPIQSTALIFTALVLGWVRLRTRSVLPGMALHLVNNGLGVAGALFGAADADMPFAAALGAGVVTLALCALLAREPVSLPAAG